MQPIHQVKIIKDPFYRRLVGNPFKYYRRAGGMTFCLVAISNLFTTMVGMADSNNDRKKFLSEHPQMYFMSLLLKSTYFGLLWPAFYIEAIHKPKNAFVLGAGVDSELCKIENQLRKMD